MEQKKVKKESPKKEEAQPKPAVQDADKTKKVKEDIDKLLDEIDDILEENAEEFVKSYVQRGGE